MTKTVHTAVDPNGKVHKRTSESRKYSHVVFYRTSYEKALNDAKSTDYRRLDRSNYDHFMAFIDGTSRFLPQSHWESDHYYAQRRANDIAKAKEQIGDAKSFDEYTTNRRNAAVARVEQKKAEGLYDVYHCAGWNGRLDLAQKAAAQCRTNGCVDVVIAETKIV
jgi:hypothetical protein